jgi:hypothetical protein
MPRYYVGLDLGQAHDYTAVVVAENIERSDQDTELHIRWLERLRDVLYPDVAARLKGLMDAPELGGRGALAVDATGVGAAVVDMLRETYRLTGCRKCA